MQPELHWFTKQTAGLEWLFCQVYKSCFITDSALMVNAHTLISFYYKVKRKPQYLGSIYAVQVQIPSVVIGMEDLDFIPNSQILFAPACYFSLDPDSKFRFYTSHWLVMVTWRWCEVILVQCYNLGSLKEDSALGTRQRNTWHHWVASLKYFSDTNVHEE